MSDKVKITKEMVERARNVLVPEARGHHSMGTVELMLYAALNPPEHAIVVTGEMSQAGCDAYLACAAKQEAHVRAQVNRPSLEAAYRVMHALAPLPEVTNEALRAFFSVWFKSTDGLTEMDDSDDMMDGARRAITKALPILLGRKNGVGVGGACAPEVKIKAVYAKVRINEASRRTEYLRERGWCEDDRGGLKDRRCGHLGNWSHAPFGVGRRYTRMTGRRAYDWSPT